ncbi:MAG TPA: quinol:electron acceptor oxidoreductase subunit ActD [Anaerolineales bacterium]|nr:quinol:electron acceptor oxidoreductase subunit ActD [Anaerolineales bacterium]
MTNLIGGLFQTQENANLVYDALQTAGFAAEDIHTFVHKPRKRVERSMDVPIQEIAKVAFVGALIGGAIGGFLGWLVGIGTISLPYLEPGSAPREPLFVFMSVVSGLITGGLTGAILGVASKLLGSREKAEVMTREIEKRGVLVTVSLDGAQREAQARRVLEDHGAVEVGNPSEKWDLDAWASPNETAPSLRNLANTG